MKNDVCMCVCETGRTFHKPNREELPVLLFISAGLLFPSEKSGSEPYSYLILVLTSWPSGSHVRLFAKIHLNGHCNNPIYNFPNHKSMIYRCRTGYEHHKHFTAFSTLCCFFTAGERLRDGKNRRNVLVGGSLL